MTHSQSAPTRSLPANPSLAQLRKQAKELLKSFRAGEPTAVIEVERFERQPDPSTFALADAQRVLARAYGFASWTKLKQHVVGVTVEAFCRAADAGDIATVRKLAKARPELVNAERGGRYGENIALHFAVLNRDAPMARALMELGSDARKGIWPHRDATAAHTIASERGYDEIVAIIEDEEELRRKQMSSFGATINSDADEILTAIRDGRDGDAKRILELDVSLIGACNTRGVTPLHVAAWRHSPRMVAWLLERDANPNAPDAVGQTPLDHASLVAGWSSHGRDFCFLENSRVPPEHFHDTVDLLRAAGAALTPRAAVAIGDRDVILQMHGEERLTVAVNPFRGGLLSIAVRVNRPDMVALLLDLGLDPDETVLADDGSPLSWGMPLWFAAMCGRHEIARLLLVRGADVNAVVYACGDATSIADRTKDQEFTKLLLDHGARLTVEHVAGKRDIETAKAILNGTVAAQSLNVSDPSPTDLAEQMLWAAGPCEPEIVRLCLPHITRASDDPWWNYVLVSATLPECFQLVLQHGVDPDVAAKGGYTILHHLATNHVAGENRLNFATMLLDAGASLTKRDPLLMSTPLGWACRWGRLNLVQLYLQRGAVVHESDAEPWATPLAWARKAGHRDIVELLHSRGTT
jgi:ankyrin repeat protein